MPPVDKQLCETKHTEVDRRLDALEEAQEKLFSKLHEVAEALAQLNGKIVAASAISGTLIGIITAIAVAVINRLGK